MLSKIVYKVIISIKFSKKLVIMQRKEYINACALLRKIGKCVCTSNHEWQTELTVNGKEFTAKAIKPMNHHHQTSWCQLSVFHLKLGYLALMVSLLSFQPPQYYVHVHQIPGDFHLQPLCRLSIRLYLMQEKIRFEPICQHHRLLLSIAYPTLKRK